MALVVSRQKIQIYLQFHRSKQRKWFFQQGSAIVFNFYIFCETENYLDFSWKMINIQRKNKKEIYYIHKTSGICLNRMLWNKNSWCYLSNKTFSCQNFSWNQDGKLKASGKCLNITIFLKIFNKITFKISEASN